jgi:DNA-binding NarL/FixJ family response regulator
LRILIADDQREVRSAVRLLLEHELQLTNIAEAADADDLLTLLASPEATVVILDWELCSAPAEFLAILRSATSDCRVIATSGRPDARHEALETGADRFVSKGDAPDELIRALVACGVHASSPPA